MTTSSADPVILLAERRRAILDKVRPIENAHANMHPDDPDEAETDATITALHRQVEAIEQQMAAVTAASVAGLIEQLEALKAHIAVETPEHEPLVDAVLRGLRSIKSLPAGFPGSMPPTSRRCFQK